MKLKLNKLACMKCGHVWVPRIPHVVQCPKCKSASFDKPKRVKKQSAPSPD